MSRPPVRFSLGLSDFRSFPRPRRFGKTLNLSTLRCFFEKSPDDVRPLFADLAVESSERAWAHFQKYRSSS